MQGLHWQSHVMDLQNCVWKNAHSHTAIGCQDEAQLIVRVSQHKCSPQFRPQSRKNDNLSVPGGQLFPQITANINNSNKSMKKNMKTIPPILKWLINSLDRILTKGEGDVVRQPLCPKRRYNGVAWNFHLGGMGDFQQTNCAYKWEIEEVTFIENTFWKS